MQNSQHKVNTLITKIKIKADLIRMNQDDLEANKERMARMREFLIELEETMLKETTNANQ